MTLDELKENSPSMIALVERALMEDFIIPFTSSRRAENFRREFYKFRGTACRELSDEDAKTLRSIKTKVEGKNLIFSTRKLDHAPAELLKALGLAI